MSPQDMDRILAQAANRSATQGLDSAAIARAKASLPSSFGSVRSMRPAWVYASLFVAAFAAVALGGAWAFAVRGLPVLSLVQRAVIFPVVIAGAWIAAVASVREMRPASGTRSGAIALAIGTLAPLTAFAFLFQNYNSQNFVPEGVKCLVAGLACAIPAALLISLILRRGFILDYRAAGLTAGTLAGLAGLGMLELHCPILKAPHIMFWHVAVVWVSGIAGWLAGWMLQRAKRRHAEN
jgi:hypothetical protein